MEELFDLSQEYDAMLNEGLSVSGESKMFFIEGRLYDIRNQLKGKIKVRRILDFGCGIGDATAKLLEYFPEAEEIIGTDLSAQALDFARTKHGSEKIKFVNLETLDYPDYFDFCYVNGVFHHIPIHLRAQAMDKIYSSMKLGGFFALCENNPLNPGTQLIMSRIPFDRDAIKIPFYKCQDLIRAAGFSKIVDTRFLFYFPKMLSFLRPMEAFLAKIPLGAQYYVLAKK